LWLLVAGTAAMLAAVLFVPALQQLFRFAPLRLGDFALALVAGLACLGWLEILERGRRVRRATSVVSR
jgi:Ca2+-transporting ATPase